MTENTDTYDVNLSSVSTYEVGYKKPPVHTQFKSGNSGNPRGRKKVPNITELLFRELGRRILINEGGEKIKITKREALVKQIVKKAIMGDNKCLDFLIRIEEMHVPAIQFDRDDTPIAPDRRASPVWKRFQKEFGIQKSPP